MKWGYWIPISEAGVAVDRRRQPIQRVLGREGQRPRIVLTKLAWE